MKFKLKQIFTLLLFISLIAAFVAYRSGVFEKKEDSLIAWAQKEDFPIFEVDNETANIEVQTQAEELKDVESEILTISDFYIDHISSTKYFIPFSLYNPLPFSSSVESLVDSPRYNWRTSPARSIQNHESPQ